MDEKVHIQCGSIYKRRFPSIRQIFSTVPQTYACYVYICPVDTGARPVEFHMR